MEKYTVSNMVMENAFIDRLRNKMYQPDGVYSESVFGDIKICRINVTDEKDEIEYNCGRGSYVTVYTPPLWRLDPPELETAGKLISREIRKILLNAICGESLEHKSFLIVGLGNRQITPDAIGPLTAEKISVTRHVALMDPAVFKKSGLCSVSSVSSGVMGETGVKSLELIKGVVEQIKPDAVIAVDALAAKECKRLAATVQISDVGISPGAGIGNRQSAINRETLGIPVIAIGVPTVVSAATLIGEALNKCIGSEISDCLRRSLDEGKNFFVAPKECDLIANAVSDLLARALERALGVI